MSSEIAIKVSNLSKCYQIYEKPHDRLKQYLYPRLQRMTGRKEKKYFSEFWALKDISFEIRKGETVGIIGRNGSGKSTLLQIICGTLNPSSGSVQTNGRIAALLELGSGFNPEFTGRENVYMNAAVLGLSKEEIDARFDDIVAFADIGDFVGQSVKTYSSGMMVRLAFAVAINVNPEILIVDEALSVGDELFQRKCFSRIEAIRANGATILFVSHSGAQIVELCDRAILLDAGESLGISTPKRTVGQYQKLLYAPADVRNSLKNNIRQDNAVHEDKANLAMISPASMMVAQEQIDDCLDSFDPSLKPTSTIEYESRGAYIENPCVLNEMGEPVNNLIRGRSYQYVYDVRFNRNVSNVRFGMLIKTISGLELGGGVTAMQLQDALPMAEEGKMYRVKFSFRCLLNTGTYFLNAGVTGDINGVDGYLHRLVDVAMFRVMPDVSGFSTGIVDFLCVPEIKKMTSI